MKATAPMTRLVGSTEACAILSAFLDGKAICALIKDLHRSYEAITDVLDEIKRSDLPILTGLTDEQINGILARYLEGELRGDIAFDLKLPIGSINLVTYGIKRPPGTTIKRRGRAGEKRSNVSTEDKARIIDLYHRYKVPKNVLCRQFNRSEPTIRKILEEAGVFRLNEALSKICLFSKRHPGHKKAS